MGVETQGDSVTDSRERRRDSRPGKKKDALVN